MSKSSEGLTIILLHCPRQFREHRFREIRAMMELNCAYAIRLNERDTTSRACTQKGFGLKRENVRRNDGDDSISLLMASSTACSAFSLASSSFWQGLPVCACDETESILVRSNAMTQSTFLRQRLHVTSLQSLLRQVSSGAVSYPTSKIMAKSHAGHCSRPSSSAAAISWAWMIFCHSAKVLWSKHFCVGMFSSSCTFMIRKFEHLQLGLGEWLFAARTIHT